MKILSYGTTAVLIGIALGVASGLFFPYSAFAKISGSLLVLFSILAGLLAQVMVFTAMIVTPERISLAKVDALERAFTDQQEEWRIQFVLYVTAVVLCAAVGLFGKEGLDILKGDGVTQAYVGISVALACWAALRSLRIPSAIISLQRLRFAVIRDEMKASAEKERLMAVGSAEALFPKAEFKGRQPHPGHGSIIDAPRT